MGYFRFRRSIRLLPGIRLNIGKRGVSTSIGIRGAHVTLGHGQVRETVGLPGTGLIYTHVESNKPHELATEAPQAPATPSATRGWVWIVLFVIVVAVVLWASRSRADDAPDPCALQFRAMMDALDKKSEYEEASANYKKCASIAAEQKKTEFAETRSTWAASLARLPGGWTFLLVDSGGEFAIFGSTRHATRTGNVVSVWLRWEYREVQSGSTDSYKSFVERVMYDCSRVASKKAAITYYVENNLSGAGASYTYDEAKVAWEPAIPGTIGDSLLDWACRAVPRASPAKSN